jgi:hypothetical protein
MSVSPHSDKKDLISFSFPVLWACTSRYLIRDACIHGNRCKDWDTRHSIWTVHIRHALLQQWVQQPSPHGSTSRAMRSFGAVMAALTYLKFSYGGFKCGVQLAVDTGIEEVQKIQKLSASPLSYEP